MHPTLATSARRTARLARRRDTAEGSQFHADELRRFGGRRSRWRHQLHTGYRLPGRPRQAHDDDGMMARHEHGAPLPDEVVDWRGYARLLRPDERVAIAEHIASVHGILAPEELPPPVERRALHRRRDRQASDHAQKHRRIVLTRSSLTAAPPALPRRLVSLAAARAA